MKIDRSNYEILFIDWLDGNLNDSQIEQLQQFLRDNSDLKDEFDDLSIFRLNPAGKSFSHKDHLKKTISDLSESQFDYLSVAYLENDLSASQQTELRESIAQDRNKNTAFELIQKTRLAPVVTPYRQKGRLIRRTIAQNVIRLSLIGLSAAAITTFVVITYFSTPRTITVKSEKTSQAIRADSIVQQPAEIRVPDLKRIEKQIITVKKKSKNLLAESQEKVSAGTEADIVPALQNDSLPASAGIPRMLLNKIAVNAATGIRVETIPNTLIAFNSTVTVPEYDDGRSKLSKFIAKTFREKILKEKNVKDSPLKIYEIAEAGVSGLNKLLGWQMALDKRNDENGELKSVYFSSKILKFNAPVKKSEPLQ